jgi:hypothetical protein
MPKAKLVQRKSGNGVKMVKRPRDKGRVVPRLRDWEVMKYREQGHSYNEISQLMMKHHKIQLSPQGCRDIVVKTLQNMQTNLSETVEQVRQMELNRLDSMLTVATKMAQSRGKGFLRLGAIDRVVKIGERRSKLMGLEIDKHEHTHMHAVRIYHGTEEYEQDTNVTVDSPPMLESGDTE